MTTEKLPFGEKIKPVLAQFIPRTLDERLMALRERLNQAWPTFHKSGSYDWNILRAEECEAGTMVRFYAGSPITFHPVGAIKHGPSWILSGEIEGKTRFTASEMRAFLFANKLNWVIIK